MNLRLVRKKIKSIKNVRKITKAMQMVSAVKMRKAQQAEMESRPYRDGIISLIDRLSGDITQQPDIISVDATTANRDILIVITSNKGLAGAFNMNIFRYLLAKDLIQESTDYVVIGHKGAQVLSRIKNMQIIANFTHPIPSIETSAIFDFVLSRFMTGSYRSVSIVYNRFISTMRSEVIHQHMLPLTPTFLHKKTGEEERQYDHKQHIMEPSARMLLKELVLSYLEQIIRGALISSEAVEHSARMMAMKSATDNASDLMNRMTLLSNRLRQEKITYELLDMITAKESVG